MKNVQNKKQLDRQAKRHYSLGKIIHGTRKKNKTLKIVELKEGGYKVIFNRYLWGLIIYQQAETSRTLDKAKSLYIRLGYQKFKGYF